MLMPDPVFVHLRSGMGKNQDPGSAINICKNTVLRIRDVYPGFLIPDPKTATKERGEKHFVVITFYVATNFTKLQIIEVLKKKIRANFQRIIELFTQKNCQ
jgi:hypothetical protein